MGNGVTVKNTASVSQRDVVDSLTKQLAKANERVKELEERCSSHEKDMLRQCVFMEKTAEKLEQHREWQATANVLRRPTREAKQAINKFAIEKKIEALDCCIKRNALLTHDFDEKVIYVSDIQIDIEQLRKEQE